MIIDLHTHTTTSSPCSIMSPLQLIGRAKEMHLDAVAVTEHGTLRGAQVAYELGQQNGLLVLRGQEIRTSIGDVLVFGYPRDLNEGMNFFYLADAVHTAGGAVILAHPYRFGRPPVETLAVAEAVRRQLDAIEVLNLNCSAEQNRLAQELATHWSLPAVAGSDAHTLDWVGRYVTVFPQPIADEAALVAAIRRGETGILPAV